MPLKQLRAYMLRTLMWMLHEEGTSWISQILKMQHDREYVDLHFIAILHFFSFLIYICFRFYVEE